MEWNWMNMGAIDDVANADIRNETNPTQKRTTATATTQKHTHIPPAKREIEQGNRSANKLDYYKLIKYYGPNHDTQMTLTTR